MPSTGNERGASRFRNRAGNPGGSPILQMLWTLIRLRQLLLWAQARTSTGRRALFASGYVLGGSLFLLLILAGSETAALSKVWERDEVAIIKAGRLVWHGSLSHLAAGIELASHGQRFHSLEALYLALVGEHGTRLEWL